MTDPGPVGAVLVGTSRHLVEEAAGGLPDLPQTAENLVDLATALTRPGGLFPPGSVETVLDPDKPQVVYEAIARQPQHGTLLFYFAGHGINADYRLCLALPHSIDRRSVQRGTSLPVDALLEQLTAPKRRRVIMILDCCYASLALDETRAADVHLLAAVGRAYKARGDGPDPRHTVFTHFLLRALNEGIPDGSRFLTLDSLFRYIRQGVLAGWDVDVTPHQRAVDDSGEFRLGSNPAYEAVLSPAGFAARDALATGAGLHGDRRWAARLAADLARECDRSTLIGPAERFTARLHAAVWCGHAGEPREAARQIRSLIAASAEPGAGLGMGTGLGMGIGVGTSAAEDVRGASAEDMALAMRSLEYWDRVVGRAS